MSLSVWLMFLPPFDVLTNLPRTAWLWVHLLKKKNHENIFKTASLL